MRSGTTTNWTVGTTDIGLPQRVPYHLVNVEWTGTGMSIDTSGSLYHDDMSGTDWPSWLSIGTTGTASITRGGGTACFQTNANAGQAYVVSGTAVGTLTSPLVFRTKGWRDGTASQLTLMDVADGTSAPAPTTALGKEPAVTYLASGSRIILQHGGVNVGTYGEVVGSAHIAEVLYDGTNLGANIYGTNGTIAHYSNAHTFANKPWLYMGDLRTSAEYGTLWANYIQVFRGTDIKVGNVGSGWYADLYGSHGSVVGSAISSSVPGTITIPVTSLEFPYLGYIYVYSGSDKGTTQGRYPSSGNGTLWGGDVYKKDEKGGFEDISSDVMSLKGRMGYEDSLTGRVPSGAISGDLDLTLATGSKYSYFNTASPFYATERLNRPVSAYTGFVSAGTNQYLQAFEGYSSSLSVANGETEMHCLDKSEDLRRRTVTLGLEQGIRSDRLIRKIIKRYADFTVTFDNDAFPTQYPNIIPNCDYVQYSPGAFGNATRGTYPDQNFSWALERPDTLPKDWADEGFISFWSYGTHSSAAGVTGTTDSGVTIQVFSGSVSIVVSGSYLIGSLDPAAGIGEPGTGWNHLCATWDAVTEKQLDVYLNNAFIGSCYFDNTKYSGLADSVGVRTDGSLTRVDQLDVGPLYLDSAYVGEVYSTPSEPAIIDPGLNTLEYAWIENRDAWNLIKDICQAEGASAYFDAEGIFHFENRLHFYGSGNYAPVKTLNAGSDIASLEVSEDIDSVVNEVIVKASPLQNTGGTEIWSAQDIISVEPNSTRTLWAEFQDPAVGVDTTFTGTYGTGKSRFAASMLANGSYWDATGSVTVAGTAYGKSMLMKITNTAKHQQYPHIGDYARVWMTGTDYQPRFGIWGSSLQSVDGPNGTPKIYAKTTDTDSMAKYGTKSLVIDNPFITNLDYAEFMSEYLCQQYAVPRPRIEGLTIAADPRLEPGDMVTVVDDSGHTGLNDNFWILSIDWGQDPYTQDLTVEYAAANTIFILDHATQGRLDLNTLGY